MGKKLSLDDAVKVSGLVPIVIDTDGLTKREVEGFLPLIDNAGVGARIIAMIVSSHKMKGANFRKTVNLGLPYKEVLFVDPRIDEQHPYRSKDDITFYKQTSLTANFGENFVLFTKDYELAHRLKPEALGVYIYG